MEGYTIQKEALRILHDVLLKDERLDIPEDVKRIAASRVVFDESAIQTPLLPAPVKCTESSTALWGLLAAFGASIAEKRYGVAAVGQQKAVVNSDVATLFLFSFLLLRVGGRPTNVPSVVRRYSIYDTKRQMVPWRRLATTVYPTRDGRFFHLHGGMNSDKSLRMLSLPPQNEDLKDELEIINRISREVEKHDAEWLDVEANEHWRQAGGICLTPQEFRDSEQGRAIARTGLYTIEASSTDVLPPVPWPETKSTTKHVGAFRPLEGIKLVDLTRAIAGPTIARLAALLGATVVRVSNMDLPDLGIVLFESNLGKRDAHADLRTEEGRQALLSLIEDADIVLDGYRPGAMERLGFGPTFVHALARRRGRGIVYARENCHGWSGPWSHRSGWQQISDAVTGVAWLFGRMWGVDEPIMPFLPNSDFQTGIVGCIAILHALTRRAEHGGNYLVSTSLNQLNCFLIGLGEQSPEAQQAFRERWPGMKFRHYDDLHRQMPVVSHLKLCWEREKEKRKKKRKKEKRLEHHANQRPSQLLATLPKLYPQLLNPKYFVTLQAELGVPDEEMTFVGPPITYEKTKLYYSRGSCMRGTDTLEWPEEGQW